ncbi:hypothetical protein GA0061094_2895 [[Bacillus] enclensis]|jgi:hypothetical protein|uniref:Uncharacterized protein n=2 Tax=Rossellomorea TaxID=2837508 RepID=A0A1C4CEF4_9BACI|nr:hypothetical protein [[Bacillus] enclensis]MBH9967231.1 hypothetical protein [[Bacillus] enclensis]QTC41241.1 hypothetical protein I7V34_19560 [Bacillus sp. V3]QWC23332.1 hypothetical protein KJK41_02850 [Bacillus haikouensis]SCC17426.1 hypothetical protein GA0061094_2895 [[Bacillus] enclensis]
MARGKSFEAKKKGHPGNFPNNSTTERHTEKPPGDEELIVTQEAFKNRVDNDEHRL